jgi:streptogramin lyase
VVGCSKRGSVAGLVVLMAAGATVVGVGSAHATMTVGVLTSTVATTQIDEWPVPLPDGSPGHVINGPDSALWAEASGTNDVYRFDSRDGALLSTYRLPAANHSVNVGMANGPDGNVWVTLNGTQGTTDTATTNNRIVQITPSGSETFFDPTVNSTAVGPGAITAGPSSDPNSMWFADTASGGGFQLGRIGTTGTHPIQNWSLPTLLTSDYTMAVTLGPDANGTPNADLWVATYGDTATNDVFMIDVSTGVPVVKLTVQIPVTWHTPFGNGIVGGTINATTGKQDGVWLNDDTANHLGHISATGDMTIYQLSALTDPVNASSSSASTLLPRGLVVNPERNTIWFALQGIGCIAELNPATNVVTLYRAPDDNPRLQYVAYGPDHNIWFTSVDQSRIGRIDLHPVADPSASTSSFTVSGKFFYNHTITQPTGTQVQMLQTGFPFGLATSSPNAAGTNLEVTMAQSDRFQRVPTSMLYTLPPPCAVNCVVPGPPPADQEQAEPSPGSSPTQAAAPWRTIAPQTEGQPRLLVTNVGSSHQQWATMYNDTIENITPGDGVVTGDSWGQTATPGGTTACCVTTSGNFFDGPADITTLNNNVWFSAFTSNHISRVDSSTVTQQLIPTPDSGPYGLTTQGSLLWFTEFNTGKVGSYDPAAAPGQAWHEYPVGTSTNSQPFGITAASDGYVYFTLRNENEVGRIDPATGATHYWPIQSTPNSQPTSITTGPGNALFVTEYLTGKVARLTYDPTSLLPTWTEWALPYGDLSRPLSIKAGPDGNIWVTLPYVDRIARLTP